MATVIIYTKAICPYCDWAKKLLDSKKVTYQEIRVDTDPAQRETMERLSGRRTVPQIFINDHPVGGFDDLSALDKAGKLDLLLNK
ncbi:MAG: glutaredoxin 3 [Gammaproteobacteria bacterium]|nr:glutaredoxin 3 [Gammaproteobacteria bacterium]